MLLVTLGSLLLAAQEKDLVDQLLDRPAPAADWQRFVPPRPEERVPGDDAPLELLAGYWTQLEARVPNRRKTPFPKPSDKVRARLLEAAEQNPGLLTHVLDLIPDTGDAYARVRKILRENENRTEDLARYWAPQVREWMLLHDPALRDELAQAAERVSFKDGWMRGEELVRGLARLDWARAVPVLEKLLAGGEPRLGALALSVQYRHAIDAKDEPRIAGLRDRLQGFVADRTLPARARTFAFEALAESDWTGRETWVLSLFEDPSLREMHDGSHGFAPLAQVVRRDPDRWIPAVAQRIGAENRAVHDMAVSCLVQFHLEDARSDALRPLLPWLSDPGWSSARDRLRLIQSLDRVDLPESVPGLIWVVDHSCDFELSGAASALARTRDPRAIPALKASLQRPDREFQRRAVVQALVDLKGVSDDEIVESIEAYAVLVSTEKGRERIRESDGILPKGSLPAKVSLGLHLSYLKPEGEEAPRRLLERGAALKGEAGETLRAIVYAWPRKSVDLFLLRALASGKAGPGGVAALLERREKVKTHAADELRALGGAARGAAAVIAGDAALQAGILKGTGVEAQRMLLACARLVREPIDEKLAASLLKSPEGKLALAAERYLETLDTAEARRLVWARHPGEVLILGAMMEYDPGHVTFGEFAKWEERLRGEMRAKDGPDELFALLTGGYWGGRGQRVIRIRGGRAESAGYDREGKPSARELGAEPLRKLRAFLADEKVDDLPPYTPEVHDGIQVVYLHLRKEGGRRVFMNNPGTSAGSVYDRLYRHFDDLHRN